MTMVEPGRDARRSGSTERRRQSSPKKPSHAQGRAAGDGARGFAYG